MYNLSGKSAIVTGSSRGIGRAIAESLAANGAQVAISSRKSAPCEEVAALLNANHGHSTAIAVPANISIKADLQKLVDDTNEAFGKIDIVVCNAATNPYYGPLENISDEQFEKILSNNIISNHWLIQMCVPQMRARRSGSIIVVSSIGGLKASVTIGAYNVSKAADFQLVRNLAAEYGPSNIRVNAIAPGLVRTDFARALWEDPETLKLATSNTPMRRIGEPHEVAGAAVYLASEASSFVTGQMIIVDGGATIV